VPDSRPPLYLYDDAAARAFEPFALTRPAGELRAGAELVRRRWERALGARAAGFIAAPHLAGFAEFDAPPAAGVDASLPAGALVVNARCAPRLAAVDPGAAAWVCDGRVAAVRLAAPLPVGRLADGTLALDELAGEQLTGDHPRAAFAGWWMDAVWDYIGHLQPMLGDDVLVLGAECERAEHPGAVLGAHPVFVERGATVEPYVVLDAAAGPVLVRRGATVQAFTRVVGPCFVGEGATITADKISGCSIGEVSRVHGEISASIVLGHANKSHDGFVGHSYLGRWANLGAGTTTSNLKNTYGTVALWTPGGVRDTGLQFLGTLLGDHAKTGIGLRLTTGSVVGAGANVYDAMPPKFTPPFSWGGSAPYDVYDVERFVRVAARAMQRRGVVLAAGPEAVLRAAHARATAWHEAAVRREAGRGAAEVGR
jgi:UDP-N-acetylglucosamine diphosphorylase/glucosamine-1-phosphate N-acetyltransferase